MKSGTTVILILTLSIFIPFGIQPVGRGRRVERSGPKSGGGEYAGPCHYDHGVLYAAVDFYKEAKKNGLKPLIGFEAYVARRNRMDRVPRIDDSQYHLILLARNSEGYRNLVRLCSRGFMEGFYYKPRSTGSFWKTTMKDWCS
jgi:DNA polymerase III alpha subunit